jgi:hypothetical protein
VIEVSKGSLIRRIHIAGLGINREYDVSHIKALRLSPMDTTSSRQASYSTFPFGKTAGPIAFDYGAKTIRFGGGIDEAETKHLIEELRPFLPKSSIS